MAFGHGKDAVVKLDNAADSLTDISAYVTEVGFTVNGEAVDVTTLGAVWHDIIAGLKSATITINGIFDPTVDAILFAAINALKSFEYHPQGTGSGSPKYTCELLGTSYNPTSPIGGASTWTFAATVDGAATRGTN